jgi:hypothetical protein
MGVPAEARSEPTLAEELRSSAMLFAMALATTVGTVVLTRLLLKVIS